MVRMVKQDFPVDPRTNNVVGLHGGELSAGLSAVMVPTRVSDGSLWVFGRRHGDEHHGDVVGRLFFAQGEEVVHPWRGQQNGSDQGKSDQMRSEQNKSEQDLSDLIRSDSIRPGQIKSDQIRSDQIEGQVSLSPRTIFKLQSCSLNLRSRVPPGGQN